MRQPMLAATLDDPRDLRFPLLVSPKIDGIRAVIVNGVPLTRRMKPIPNRHVALKLSGLPPLDGELLVPNGGFNETQSAVMAGDGQPAFFYYVFDLVVAPAAPFAERYARARQVVETLALPNVRLVPHILVPDVRAFLAAESAFVDGGAEGIMARDPHGPYKQGRSTLREGWLTKFKRFTDAEARVVGFIERQHNGNAATTDERGYTKRSTAKAGKIGNGTLGKLLVRRDDGVEFGVGTGFDEAQRAEIWKNRDAYLGRLARYKHQEHGSKDAPRFPTFIGWRDARDA